MYDAIVVGARCAGSPTAMLLARHGYRVLLVDRTTFPSDTLSTHAITYRGLVKLQAWGLYDQIKATGCPEVIRRTIDLGDFPLTGEIQRANGLPGALCPRRTVLDKALVDAAVAAGVELREGYAVRDLVMDDGRVTGIRGAQKHGRVQTDRARIVIGADGKRSLVARKTRAKPYHEEPPLMCWYYSYWEGLIDNPHGLGSYTRQQRKVLTIPTNDGLTCVLVGWPHAEFSRVRSDIGRHFLAAVHRVSPLLWSWLQGSQRVDRYYGTADLPNFFRTPYGPGWALVGDAGYHRDPVAAHGIADAFRDADLLSGAVHLGLSEAMPMEAALSGYEQARNRDALPRYHQNCRAARFCPPTDQERALRRALRDGPQADIDAYLSAHIGTLPKEAFFNPETMARILTPSETQYSPVSHRS